MQEGKAWYYLQLSFSCTTVQSPDVDNYEKLVQGMMHLSSTVHTPFMHEAKNANLIYWWVHTSYATHANMKSHTCGAISLGKGSIHGVCTEQNNTNSSCTKAELEGCLVSWPKCCEPSTSWWPLGLVLRIMSSRQITTLCSFSGKDDYCTKHINIQYHLSRTGLKREKSVSDFAQPSKG